MSWITIAWSMAASACLTLAIVHLVIWLRQTDQLAHLLFSVTAISVTAIAACELLMMRAQTTEQFGTVLRWAHLPLFFAVVSVVGFVRFYFRAGRPWLAYTVCGLRLLALIINFFSVPNLNYKQITALRHLATWGGETISVAEGVPNPWTKLGELSSLLLLLFVADASVTLWRRGDRTERRRALVVGGSITFCILVAAGNSALLHAGLIHTPYLISFPFLVIVAAMGSELSSDVVRAALLTRQLQASEAALRESEARFRILADTAPVMVWMSGTDMLCNFFNKQWLEFTGRTLKQELGNGWSEGVHPEDLQRCLETYVSNFNGRRPFTMEYRLRRDDGEYRWMLDNGVPRYTPEGGFAGYIGSCIDITPRKQAELEAARQRNELAHLSRVSLLGELSGSFAHELNQPLTAILSNAQAAQRFLARNAADPAELNEILNDIVEEDKRAGEVIRGIHLLLKKGEVQLQALDVNEVVHNVLKLLHSDLVNQNVAVHVELALHLPAVNGDGVQLQQVLLNLVVNGCDAMADIEAVDRKLLVRTELADGKDVRVSVADQGYGIPPEKIDRIFEPFFTTKVKGMGMGLAVCRTIISAHGGRLWATNNPKRGATFQFTLPTNGKGTA
jgi:two-component system, LuxR family, sensor kinase FixL